MRRLLDVVGALTGLLLFSRLLVIVALLVRKDLGDLVLFRQTRWGLHGRPVRMLKLRSIWDSLGPDGYALPDEQRLMHFGRWPQASSLDELSELWSVLKGDMSLVGARSRSGNTFPAKNICEDRLPCNPSAISGFRVCWARKAWKNCRCKPRSLPTSF